MGLKYLLDNRTRSVAFVVVGSLFIGNILAETGDAAVNVFHLAPKFEHIILACWLAIGILYIIGSCKSLARRRGNNASH